MARQFRTLKNTYTSGEQDPSLALREDIKHYYNGADKLRNVIVRPQGGVDRRWGTRWIDYLLPNIRTGTLNSGATATAPNGGTANNARDDTGIPGTVVTTTNNIGVTNPYVVIHYDLGSQKDIVIAEVRNALLTNASGVTSSQFCIQYSTDNVTFTTLGDPIDVLSDTAYATRRRSPPHGTVITARYWRFARIGATDLGTARCSISDFILREALDGSGNPTLSQGFKMIPIDYSATQKYMLVASDDNVAVYLDEVWQTDIRHTPDGSDLASLNWCQSFDTVLTFFQDEQPAKLVRAGADNEWTHQDIAFDQAPVYQFTDTPQPGSITLDPSAVSGNGITLTASSAFFTSAMGSGWVFELPSYKGSGGGVFISTAFTDSTHLVGDVLEDFASVATAVPNAVVREPAFTAARGYPGGGVFHEGRLYLFNHPQAKNVIWASRVGLPFNFDDSQTLDDYGFVLELTGDNPPQIFSMVSGRHLQIFCHASEFYVLPNDSPITPNTVVAKHTTDSGSKQIGLRPASVDGATLFARRGGVEIDEFVFADTEQAYQADPVSLLSSHLLNDVQQLFAKPATNTAETNQLYAVNGDGTLYCMATLRRQDVAGASLLKTEGSFLQGEVVGDKIFLCVEREINGVTKHFLEVADNDSLTDCGKRGSITYETYTATAGQTVFTWTFTDPASASLVGVKVNSVTLEYLVDYTVNLGSNTVTLIGDYAGTLEAGDTVTLHQLVGSLTAAHLPNTEVQIIVDGAVQTPQTTDGSGVVTPDPLPYFTWEIGLKFPDVREDADGNPTGFGDEVWVRDMPIAADLPDGTVKGEMKRVFELSAEVITTGDLWIGANGEDPQLIPLRTFDDDALDVVKPYTGMVRLEGILGADRYGRTEFTQRYPAKLTLLGAAKKVAI